MLYKNSVLADSIASEIEDFLTIGSVVPVIGTLPAMLKIAFGIMQTICAASTLAASTFFLMTYPGRVLWHESFRHIIHGLSNILAGAIQAIPLIGTLLIGYQYLRHAHYSDAEEYYSNSQSHKFFGYKSLQDTSWRVEGFGKNRGIGPNDHPENGSNCSAAYCF